MDVVMDDGGVDVDVYGVGYTAGQVESAIAGATITPAQVGTESDPVGETHVSTANHDTTNTGELSVSGNGSVTGLLGDTGDVAIIGQVDGGSGPLISETYTSYDVAIREAGVVSFEELTTNTTPKVRFVALIRNNTSGETTYARPNIVGGNALTELEVTTTGTSSNLVDTGWVDLATSVPSGASRINLEMKVSSGTGNIWPSSTMFVGREIQ